MTYTDYFPADQVDESADVTQMSGNATTDNQAAGAKGRIFGSPTLSLVALWFVVLATYWAVGTFFRGQRS